MFTTDNIDVGNVIYFASISKSKMNPISVALKYTSIKVAFLTILIIWSLRVYPLVDSMYGDFDCSTDKGK